jgi:hypothetical protein
MAGGSSRAPIARPDESVGPCDSHARSPSLAQWEWSRSAAARPCDPPNPILAAHALAGFSPAPPPHARRRRSLALQGRKINSSGGAWRRGPECARGLASMEVALADWDGAIKDDEAVVASQKSTAELRGALGAALSRPLAARRRREGICGGGPGRPQAGRPSRIPGILVRAQRQTKRCGALPRGSCRARPGRPGQCVPARAVSGAPPPGATCHRSPGRTFREIQQKRLARAPGDRPSFPPLIRVELLRQVVGVAPLFAERRTRRGWMRSAVAATGTP